MLHTTKEELIREYSRRVKTGDAALFVGAGLSRSAGYVDWRGLLKEIAEDLHLDIDQESDLIAVAQYHLNHKGNRDKLNQSLINEFTKAAVSTENHRIIARLPIPTIWTTNYDTLLEDEIRAAGKIPDVKTTHENLAQSKNNRDVVIYKMHGDVSQPHNAVLTKDDYENYETSHRLFVENLKGDLISKTCLFLGFSFTDPNIDYVLSRIRILLGQNKRSHYCIMRRPQRPPKNRDAKADFEYETRKLYLRIEDLQRFGVQTVFVDEYSEVTELLGEISKRAHQRNIFVSGSAREYGKFGEDRLQGFAKELGTQIVARGYNLVSGFGLGLGEQVVLGALKAIYRTEQGREKGRTIIRPFPRVSAGRENAQKEANTNHRKDLISQSRVALFLCGNRQDEKGKLSISQGVLEEFDICRELGRFPIPVGCTGFAAKEIWDRLMKNIDKYFPEIRVKRQLKTLANPKKTDTELLNVIFAIVEKVIALDG